MGGLALIGSFSAAGAAAAQALSLFDRSENVTVQDRPRPEYDPLGMRIGVGFLLYPKVTVGETLDDNVVDLPSSDLLDVLAQELPDPQRFTQFTNRLRPLADAQLSLEPNVTIKSNWNQHSLELAADAILSRSANYPDFSANYPTFGHTAFQDSDQYSFTAAGVLNVRHDLTVNIDASFSHKLLPRTFDGYVIVLSNPAALDVATSIAPLFANVTDVKLEVVKDFSRLRLTARGEFEGSEYPNGFGPTFTFNDIGPTLQPDPAKSFLTDGPIGQDFHNHDDFTQYLRGDYALSPDFALFAEETVVESEYPNIRFRNRFDEETLVGANFQIPSLVTAEIGVGYLYSHVDYAGIKQIETPDLRANVTYFPTSLIDITLTASQHIVDSGVPQAPDYLDKSIALEANYELLRNLILTAKASLNLDDYREIDRHAQIYDEGVTAAYLMNRAMRVTLAFARRQYASSGSEAVARQFNAFTENRISLALTVQH